MRILYIIKIWFRTFSIDSFIEKEGSGNIDVFCPIILNHDRCPMWSDWTDACNSVNIYSNCMFVRDALVLMMH